MDHFTVDQIFLSAVDDQLDNRLRFLREAQTQRMAHTEGALLDHLLGTRQLLIDWEARPAVCDAGLFHSVYGTEHYEPVAIPLSMRADVRRLIGDDAELLAWLFCVMRRETFDHNLSRMGELMVQHRVSAEWLPLTTAQFHDLVTMTFANTLEAFPRLSWRVRRACRDTSGHFAAGQSLRRKPRSMSLTANGGSFGNESRNPENPSSVSLTKEEKPPALV